MKVFYLLTIYSYLILFPSAAISQNYVIKTYTIEDGLPQTQVDDICQDSFGYIWVATRGGGLGKFDGKTFTTYKKVNGLPSNIITSLIWSKNKKLWIGTKQGVSVFDGKSFRNYDFGIDSDMQYVTAMAEDGEGSIWVATLQGGVFRISNGLLSYVGEQSGFTDDQVRKIVYDPIEDKVWFCTVNEGLFFLAGHQFYKYSSPEIEKILPVLTVFNDGEQLLLGTLSGLYKKHSAEDIIESVPDCKNQVVFEINKDSAGNLWLGTRTGIVKITDGKVEELDKNNGLNLVPVKKIFEDKEGLIWFSGDHLKVSSSMLFRKIDASDGLYHPLVMNLNFDKDENLWIGTSGGGVSKYIRKDGENRFQNFPLPEIIICGIVDDGGNPWFGTHTKLYKYENDKLIKFDLRYLYPNPIFESAFKDNQGNIWWGGINNVFRYKNNVFESFEFSKSSCKLSAGSLMHSQKGVCVCNTKFSVRSIRQLKSGKIIFGTSSGLFYFENQSLTKVDIPELTDLSVLNLQEDEAGNVWLGLYGDGLVMWNPNNNTIKHYTEADGLTSGLIYCLIFDDLNRLWAGSERGLDMLEFDEKHDLAYVKNFGKQEGFMGIEANQNAVAKDKNGHIWVGTVNGIYTFDPALIKTNTTPPQLSLTGLKLFHENVNWEDYTDDIDTWHRVPARVNLPYDQNHLTFQFQAVNYKNPQRVLYSYKLFNFDENWSPPTSSREAVYANLPPGQYTFMVKSRNEDGIWNSSPVQYSFVIHAPFWMKWWFILLTLAAILIILKLFYHYSVKQKLARLLLIEKIKTEEAEKVRKIVAKDFHDEMGNHLASISVLVQLLKRKTNSRFFEIDELVEKIDKSSKTLFNGTKNFIWSIDPKNDKFYEVLLYLKDFGEDLFDNTEINFYMDVNHLEGQNLKFPPGWSRHIVLIVKEALTNCLKHANCKSVWVKVAFNSNKFKIKVIDDGSGFCLESLAIHGDGIGIESMKVRASKIKCELGIKNADPVGTELMLAGELP